MPAAKSKITYSLYFLLLAFSKYYRHFEVVWKNFFQIKVITMEHLESHFRITIFMFLYVFQHPCLLSSVRAPLGLQTEEPVTETLENFRRSDSTRLSVEEHGHGARHPSSQPARRWDGEPLQLFPREGEIYCTTCFIHQFLKTEMEKMRKHPSCCKPSGIRGFVIFVIIAASSCPSSPPSPAWFPLILLLGGGLYTFHSHG